jgi:hypothetical protein
MRIKGWLLFAVGLAAGIGFVVACNGTKHASASPGDCAVWQYADETGFELAYFTLPKGGYGRQIAGWEPFAVNQADHVVFRRCAP